MQLLVIVGFGEMLISELTALLSHKNRKNSVRFSNSEKNGLINAGFRSGLKAIAMIQAFLYLCLTKN